MDFRRFMIQGVDGEFSFLPEGGLDEGQDSPSVKFVNNNIPVVDAKPISAVHPDNASHENDDLTLIGLSIPYDLEESNTSKALVKASMFHGRCVSFKEVANFKEPFALEKMPGYRPSSKEEFDRASDGLANASYPFLVELTMDPYASMEQLLLKKPQSLHLNPGSSHSNPLSLKAP
nr:hypothetical protein [Tanacetum cinerariifolium]